jgi:hypothetical protein
MNRTLDKFAQFDKDILSKQNQNMNKHVQKLSHGLYVFQWLMTFPLLIYKKYPASRSYPRRSRSAFQKR